MGGQYDADVDSMLADCEELDEFNEREFDQHVASCYSLCSDAMELAEAAGQPGTTGPGETTHAAAGSGAVLSDDQWVLAELEHGLQQFQQAQQGRAKRQEELERMEQEHEQKARSI
eukprot:593043-Karenia_brevis.AAC.1